MNLKGATAFLCCGGPSLARQPLHRLNEHGTLVAAVNNAPVAMWRQANLRPRLWFSVDSPCHFHRDIFADPACVKYVRRRYCEGDTHYGEGRREQWKMSKHDVRRETGGQWRAWKPAMEFPGVELYEVSEDDLCTATFLDSDQPPWRSGRLKSVLLVAIWFLAKAGCSRINLLGCDFHMEPSRPYAWDQRKSRSACEEANATLHWMGGVAIPKLTQALHERGITLAVVAPEDLHDRVLAAATHQPFRHASGLYELEG